MNLSDIIGETLRRHGTVVLQNGEIFTLLEQRGVWQQEGMAARRVFEGLYECGYLAAVDEVVAQHPLGWEQSLQEELSRFISDSGYRPDLVDRLADALLVGAGLKMISQIDSASAIKNPTAQDALVGNSSAVNVSPTTITPTTDRIGKWAEMKGRVRGWFEGEHRRRNIGIAVGVGVIVTVGAIWGVTASDSEEERAQYEDTMAEADRYYDEGEYQEALDLYERAEEYTPTYSISAPATERRERAHEGRVRSSERIVENWDRDVQPLIRERRVAEAKKVTDRLPKNLALEGETEKIYKEVSKRIEEDLTVRAKEIFESVIEEVTSGRIQIPEETRREIDALLEAAPDNPWLRRIREKLSH